MRFYIPVSSYYVEFNDYDRITLIQVFDWDGRQTSLAYQNGDPILEVHELISYGQILEVYRQIKRGERKYDPYAIFTDSMKENKMENPNTWTPLHHAVSAAYYKGGAQAILEVLIKNGSNVTLQQVEEVIEIHNEEIRNHICGLSLQSLIIQKLANNRI